MFDQFDRRESCPSIALDLALACAWIDNRRARHAHISAAACEMVLVTGLGELILHDCAREDAVRTCETRLEAVRHGLPRWAKTFAEKTPAILCVRWHRSTYQSLQSRLGMWQKGTKGKGLLISDGLYLKSYSSQCCSSSLPSMTISHRRFVMCANFT